MHWWQIAFMFCGETGCHFLRSEKKNLSEARTETCKRALVSSQQWSCFRLHGFFSLNIRQVATTIVFGGIFSFPFVLKHLCAGWDGDKFSFFGTDRRGLPKLFPVSDGSNYVYHIQGLLRLRFLEMFPSRTEETQHDTCPWQFRGVGRTEVQKTWENKPKTERAWKSLGKVEEECQQLRFLLPLLYRHYLHTLLISFMKHTPLQRSLTIHE